MPPLPAASIFGDCNTKSLFDTTPCAMVKLPLACTWLVSSVGVASDSAPRAADISWNKSIPRITPSLSSKSPSPLRVLYIAGVLVPLPVTSAFQWPMPENTLLCAASINNAPIFTPLPSVVTLNCGSAILPSTRACNVALPEYKPTSGRARFNTPSLIEVFKSTFVICRFLAFNCAALILTCALKLRKGVSCETDAVALFAVGSGWVVLGCWAKLSSGFISNAANSRFTVNIGTAGFWS